MAFNKENYKKIRELYDKKWEKARLDADERRAELQAKIPELAKFDRAIADVGIRGVYATIGGGDDAEKKIKMLEEESLALQEARAALLLEHGYPADYASLRYECSTCSDTGYVNGKMCSCMRMALIMEGYRSSGMAHLLRTQTFETFSLEYYKSKSNAYDRMKQNLDMAKKFAADFKGENSGNLLMLGGTGLGKTHLSSAVAKTVIDRGFDVLYVSVMDMISDFEQERFGSGYSNTQADIEKYFECELLILDDLGTEVTNQFTVSTLYNIINTRLSKNLSTIISTNLNSKELRDRYWDRITSRLFGEYTPLVFEGTDVRLQKLKG